MRTIIVLAILVLIVGAIVFSLIKRKKSGKCGCSCGCNSCGMNGICHTDEDKK